MVAGANYDLSGASFCFGYIYGIFSTGSVYLFAVLKQDVSYAG